GGEGSMRSKPQRLLTRLLALALAPLVSTSPGAYAEEVKILKQWSGTFKASELNSLPEGQRDSRVGYIADAQTFERVWEAFTPNAENPKGVPKIDFKKDIVLFLRNTQFLNSFSSVKV